MTQGILKRLNDEAQLRTNAEVSLIKCYELAKDKLNESDKEMVKNAIKNSGFTSGSEYAKSL